jgi:hypothetical protein
VLAPADTRHVGRFSLLTEAAAMGRENGTNQGAAHVTGAMALALPSRLQLSFEEGRRALRTAATHRTDPSTGLPSSSMHQGTGRIDGQKMVQAILPEGKRSGRSCGGNVRW